MPGPFRQRDSPAERRDLLGDMEESLYLDTKAWGANVAIDQPGLYQFITETRPRLNAERQCFEQQYVKSILPVCGVEEGWERPAGLRLEVLPLTRPFGLTAGSSFTGKALGPDGPLTSARVYMDRIRTEKKTGPLPGSMIWKPAPMPTASSPSPPERPLVVLRVEVPGQPSSPDGQPTPLILGSVLWLYVDAAEQPDKNR